MHGWWCRPHNNVDLSVLNVTELCTYKRKILCYIYFTTIKKKKDSLSCLCSCVQSGRVGSWGLVLCVCMCLCVCVCVCVAGTMEEQSLGGLLYKQIISGTLSFCKRRNKPSQPRFQCGDLCILLNWGTCYQISIMMCHVTSISAFPNTLSKFLAKSKLLSLTKEQK